MLTPKISYLCVNQVILDTFNACISAIKNELTTERTIELDQHIYTVELYDDRICADSDLVVDLNNIKDLIQTIVDEFDFDVRSVFLTDDEIEDRLLQIFREHEEELEDETADCNFKRDISFSLVQNSNVQELFNLMFARSISYNENNDNEIDSIDYSDYDYTAFFDSIVNVYKNMSQIDQYELEMDHIGGEVQSEKEYLDLYCKFTLITQKQK